jgi:hypothetical protein
VGEVTLTAEEAALLKELVHDGFGPVVVGFVFDLLDNPPQPLDS